MCIHHLAQKYRNIFKNKQQSARLVEERRAYKNMASEKGVYNTNCSLHIEYYTKQLTQNFKTA